MAGPQIKIVNKTVKTVHDWDDGIEVIPDATLIYRISFKNTGDAVAKAAKLKDEIPANTTFVPKSIKSSQPVKILYFSTKENQWTEQMPANPTLIKSIQVQFLKDIPAARSDKEIEWLEYAVKVNY